MAPSKPWPTFQLNSSGGEEKVLSSVCILKLNLFVHTHLFFFFFINYELQYN